MKKAFWILTIIFSLTACNVQEVPLDEVYDNIEWYEQQMHAITNNAGYKLKEEIDENIDTSCYKNWMVKIDDTSEIWISVDFSTYESEETAERFDVVYTIEESKNPKESFELELFVDIVNVFSGKEIDAAFCEEFLQDPKQKYTLEEEELEYSALIDGKFRFLNFFEDWAIEYSLDEEYNERLSFWGLTKASTN